MGVKNGGEPVVARPSFRRWVTVAFVIFIVVAYFVGKHHDDLHPVPISSVAPWVCRLHGTGDPNHQIIRVEENSSGVYSITCADGTVINQSNTGW